MNEGLPLPQLPLACAGKRACPFDREANEHAKKCLMALHLAANSFLPNLVERFDATTMMDKVLTLIPCLCCSKINFSNASLSGFNWLSGLGWMDFFLFSSSALMGSLPRLNRFAHLVTSKADTWTCSTDLVSKMPSLSWRCFTIVRRASLHRVVYHMRTRHKTLPGGTRCSMGCNVGLGLS